MEMRKHLSPHFSHLLVTKRRKGRPECAAPRGDRGPRKRTVGYVEEAGGTRLRVGGTRFAGRAVRPDHCADAVEGV